MVNCIRRRKKCQRHINRGHVQKGPFLPKPPFDIQMSDQTTALDKKDLKNSLLLRGIELEPVLDLLEDCPVRELKEGTVLINAGKPNRFLYLVLSGRLRIHVESLDLDPIAILEPGEIAGELSVMNGLDLPEKFHRLFFRSLRLCSSRSSSGSFSGNQPKSMWASTWITIRSLNPAFFHA